MNVEDKIKLNKYAQDLTSINELLNDFLFKNINEKKQYLNELIFLLLQSKIKAEDIEPALFISGLKSSFSPVLKLKKGINQQILTEFVNLPDYDLEKTYIVFLSLYKIAYSRLYRENPNNLNKWWLNDMSDEEFLNRVRNLHEITIIVKKIYDNNKEETGAILTAFLNFPTTIFEKNIIENNLRNYALNNLYPKTGLNFYKEVHDDTCSLVVIKDLNNLLYSNIKISIY